MEEEEEVEAEEGGSIRTSDSHKSRFMPRMLGIIGYEEMRFPDRETTARQLMYSYQDRHKLLPVSYERRDGLTSTPESPGVALAAGGTICLPEVDLSSLVVGLRADVD